MQDNTMTPLQKLDGIIEDVAIKSANQCGGFERWETPEERAEVIDGAKQQLANWFIDTLKECLPSEKKEVVREGDSRQDKHDEAIWNYGVRHYNQAIEQTLATAYKVMEVKNNG